MSKWLKFFKWNKINYFLRCVRKGKWGKVKVGKVENIWEDLFNKEVTDRILSTHWNFDEMYILFEFSELKIKYDSHYGKMKQQAKSGIGIKKIHCKVFCGLSFYSTNLMVS